MMENTDTNATFSLTSVSAVSYTFMKWDFDVNKGNSDKIYKPEYC